MRNGIFVLTLVLLAGGPARAQERQNPPIPATPDTGPQPSSVTAASSGFVDFGVRGTSLDGDGARYQRYRDLGNGLFMDALRSRTQRGNWFLDAGIDHLARKDGRYDALLVRPGKVKIWGRWDQIPMLMSNTTQTLYGPVGSATLRIDDAIQSTLQNTPAAQQGAVMTNFVNTQAVTFATESRRHIGDGGFQYMPDANTTVSLDVQHINREGVIPFGATFGFGNAIEVPAPVDHRTTDVDATLERTHGPWLFRAGYDGSWFTNQNTALVWDNPYRLTDSATVPSQGELALAPSNSFVNLNGAVSVRLPRKSRATGYLAFGVLDDRGATILPQTINTALPVIPLDRTTVDGHAHTKAANLSFTSHPAPRVNVDLRYRYYDYVNQTPVFTNTSRIAYDTSVQVLNPPSESERYGGARESFDGDVTFRVVNSTAGAGYSRHGASYDDRIFESSSENTARLIFDTLSSRYFTLHSKYEHSVRRGSGLDTTDIAADGEQPGMRTFDIADRNRDLFTLTGAVTPLGSLSFSVSAGAGKDAYPNSEFGLSSAKHYLYSFGVDAVPTDRVTLGFSYDLEDYHTLQWSRQANPGVQFTDPSRDWSTDGHDRVHSVLANVEISKIAQKVDLRFGYDFNRGNTLYVYGTGSIVDRTLPEGSTVVPSSLPPPSQLPPVFGQLNRGTFDASYALTPKISVVFTYWYERYQVDDFALDAQAIPVINLPSALLIGYQYLPYRAQTYFGRLVVGW
jgi:MtrB/PioB family decaheme-associated outer membrane protein